MTDQQEQALVLMGLRETLEIMSIRWIYDHAVCYHFYRLQQMRQLKNS